VGIFVFVDAKENYGGATRNLHAQSLATSLPSPMSFKQK